MRIEPGGFRKRLNYNAEGLIVPALSASRERPKPWGRRRRRRVLRLVAVGVLAAGCGGFDQELAVGDATSPNRFVLTKPAGRGPVHSLTVSGTGRIEGEATISLLLNGQPYKTEKLSGPVSFRWEGDWYADTAEVRYEPRSVQSGRLVLRYKFHSTGSR